MKNKPSNLARGKKLNLLLIVLMMGILVPVQLFSQETIEIQFSPNILNIQSSGSVVTIHTDIAFSSVLASGVSMNGVDIQSWKADSRGFFVAKFNMDSIKDLEELEIDAYNTFILEGTKTDGTNFSGTEDVLVINKVPKGKK